MVRCKLKNCSNMVEEDRDEQDSILHKVIVMMMMMMMVVMVVVMMMMIIMIMIMMMFNCVAISNKCFNEALLLILSWMD